MGRNFKYNWVKKLGMYLFTVKTKCEIAINIKKYGSNNRMFPLVR